MNCTKSVLNCNMQYIITYIWVCSQSCLNRPVHKEPCPTCTVPVMKCRTEFESGLLQTGVGITCSGIPAPCGHLFLFNLLCTRLTVMLDLLTTTLKCLNVMVCIVLNCTSKTKKGCSPHRMPVAKCGSL